MRLYYSLRPLIPRSLQISMRRKYANRKRLIHYQKWPIDSAAATKPDDWPGWPDQKQFALVLTHDVEKAKGYDKCRQLMTLEETHGFRSAFYFVPERYKLTKNFINELKSKGFEIGVHGLKHDGKLYNSRSIFKKRADKINRYIYDWNCVGFRSPAMHHNLEWIHDLNIEYDMSTFDTDPFEPHSDGVGTIFPFVVKHPTLQSTFIEIPYTLPQDFSTFIIFEEPNTDIWEKKLDWIVEQGGIAHLITHPDYMNFGDQQFSEEEYTYQHYERFLQYIKEKYQDLYWHALPKDVALYIGKIL